MKKRGSLIIAFAMIIYLFSGCSIDQTVYLQDVHVSGPITQPPLHITANTENNVITLSPKIFINTSGNLNGRVDGHSKVNKNGVFQLDTIFNNDGTWNFKESKNNLYEFAGNNFHWSMPDALAGVDFDIHLSRLFSFFGGFNYSIIDEERLAGGSLGLGMFAEHENSGNRFDIGVIWQDMYYDASSVVVTTYHPFYGPSSQDIIFYRDKNKFTAYNFYGTWTYNSINSKMPFDYYFGLGLFGQTLVDFKPSKPDMGDYIYGNVSNDESSNVSTSYMMFMLGIYKNLDEHNRISFGLRVLKEFQIKNLSESLFIVPSIQMDMSF